MNTGVYFLIQKLKEIIINPQRAMTTRKHPNQIIQKLLLGPQSLIYMA